MSDQTHMDKTPGGYRLGEFPARWAERNDEYRDSVRRFWRGDGNMAGEFARRVGDQSAPERLPA